MTEAYINGKNVNTVQFPDKCIACNKDKCEDYIKIELFIPIHSNPTCFTNHTHQIMRLNNCGSPLIDTVKTLKKLIKQIETRTQAVEKTVS